MHIERNGVKVFQRRNTLFINQEECHTIKPSHTLSEQGLQTSLAVHLHPEEDRVFTTKESARIMTLPDDYIFTGTLNQNLARIGLMVAPICMKYLAINIEEHTQTIWRVTMKKIVAEKDLGEKETFDKWNGKFLDETSYDNLLK